jgi:hypothetical protein
LLSSCSIFVAESINAAAAETTEAATAAVVAAEVAANQAKQKAVELSAALAFATAAAATETTVVPFSTPAVRDGTSVPGSAQLFPNVAGAMARTLNAIISHGGAVTGEAIMRAWTSAALDTGCTPDGMAPVVCSVCASSADTLVSVETADNVSSVKKRLSFGSLSRPVPHPPAASAPGTHRRSQSLTSVRTASFSGDALDLSILSILPPPVGTTIKPEQLITTNARPVHRRSLSRNNNFNEDVANPVSAVPPGFCEIPVLTLTGLPLAEPKNGGTLPPLPPPLPGTCDLAFCFLYLIPLLRQS